jgi:hypothetical protein
MEKISPLVISSATFMVPAIIAWACSRYTLSKCLVLLTTTSILQHGCLGTSKYLKWIDRIYAGALTTGCTTVAIYKYATGYNVLHGIAGLCGMTSIALYYGSKMNNGDVLCHVSMHLIGAIGFSVLAII